MMLFNCESLIGMNHRIDMSGYIYVYIYILFYIALSVARMQGELDRYSTIKPVISIDSLIYKWQ